MINKLKEVILKSCEIEDIGWEDEYYIALVLDRQEGIAEQYQPYFEVSILRDDLYSFIERNEYHIYSADSLDADGLHSTDEHAFDIREVAITEDILKEFILESTELKIIKINQSI